jgi:LuxR family quorum sensing-dependent transcriptional regulator
VRIKTIAGLHESVIDYANRVHDLRWPSDVLNELHDITRKVPLAVLGAARFPPKAAAWDSLQPGSSVFLHKGAPKGWWAEYQALACGRFRPLLFLAQSRMEPYTWAEAKQIVEPIGIDRWSDMLFVKYGIRDVLSCPVGGRWVVVFWSRKALSIKQQTRNMIFAAASFSALRLEQLTRPDFARTERPARPTPREIAVLRLISTGAQNREAAKALGIGEETVRTHLKGAQLKLGVRNRAHAVAEALRQNLIP